MSSRITYGAMYMYRLLSSYGKCLTEDLTSNVLLACIVGTRNEWKIFLAHTVGGNGFFQFKIRT